jgi:hypothetical protein
MESLLDIPAFSKLGRICNQHNLDLTLFGGAVTRLVKTLGESDIGPAALNGVDNLFALAPPFSDFDISHSGLPSQNEIIQSAILDLVPNGECFRWDIRSRSEWAIYEVAAHHNNRIPARRMSLSTNPRVGFDDPLNGHADIKAGLYRFERNSTYRRSPLFRQNRDIELFSALLYLATVFEDQSARFRVDQPGFDAVADVVADACTVETIIALQESAYLRSRFHYLFALLSTLNAPKLSLEQVNLPKLLEFLRAQFPSFGTRLQELERGATNDGLSVISSARIGGDIFRLPCVTDSWSHGDQSRNDFRATLGSKLLLGGNERILSASPWMEVTQGTAPSSAAPADSGRLPMIQEFVYINHKNKNRFDTPSGPVCLDGNVKYREEDLAVFLGLRTSPNEGADVIPLVGDVCLRPDRMLIRLNAWALFEELYKAKKLEVRIFVSGWDD